MMAEIRTSIIARVAAISPGTQASTSFLPAVDDTALADDFRAWAEANPLACLRRFDVETPGDTDEAVVSWVTAEQVTESASVVIAYPRDNRFGGRSALLEVIAEDLASVEQYAGTRGFAVDPIAATIISQPTEVEDVEGAPVLFSVLPLRVTYWRITP